MDEKAVVAVAVGGQRRLVDDGNDADAAFAGAFGQQLLHPHPESGGARRGQQGKFVAAGLGQGADDGAEPGAGVVFHRTSGEAALLHPQGRRQQTGQVHAGQRRRH